MNTVQRFPAHGHGFVGMHGMDLWQGHYPQVMFVSPVAIEFMQQVQKEA